VRPIMMIIHVIMATWPPLRPPRPFGPSFGLPYTEIASGTMPVRGPGSSRGFDTLLAAVCSAISCLFWGRHLAAADLATAVLAGRRRRLRRPRRPPRSPDAAVTVTPARNEPAERRTCELY
jgi:hypothetical protein